MNRYKEQWNNYFEGGIEMWSYFGYQYHSYLIAKHLISKLDIPKEGKIVQLGTGLGIAIESLCNNFGDDRVLGYDLFNPLGHPNIHFLDMDTDVPPIMKLSYLDIDVGSMSHARDQRKKLLEWSMGNMVYGGYILTNKNLAEELKLDPKYFFNILDLNMYDIPELWKNVHQTRLNTKVLLKIVSKDNI